MKSLPSGTVTFLFTDIAGSTALLSQLGAEGYAAELAEQRRIMRDRYTAFGGVEVDTAGDGFFVAFGRASDAVAAAQAAQEALADRPARVRMGLHTGEPLVTEEGYVGIDVHRAARIAAAGHGGQILVSQTTRNLVSGIDSLDLGEQRLKDLTRPERIYQLGTQTFPPLISLNRTNLPVASHPLVGREVEQAELVALLRQRRLVTLTGAGGAGKTRLALQIAAEVLDEFPGGVFFVPLAGLSEPELVVPEITQTLAPGESRAAAAADALVVADNFEHLLDAAPDVARLLDEAPGLKLLLTSRTPLRLSSETEYPLDPLPEEAAVELFLQLAQALHRPVERSEIVNRICRRLDGLPLALELGVARLKLLAPSTLLNRLDECLPLLTDGPRDFPERQRTLEATIAWSYDLQDAEARALFLRLAIFAESFALEAAESVADADIPTLARLVDASLVKPVGQSRFLMLDTIREFALGRLDDVERARLAARHATFYLALAEEAAQELTGAGAATWLACLDADHANLRLALDTSPEPEPEQIVRLTCALWRFWFVRGHFVEAESRIGRALELQLTDTQRAELLYELGAVVLSRGDRVESRRIFEEILALYRALDDRRGEGRALMTLGHVAADEGELQEARARYEQAVALCRDTGDELAVAGILGDLAIVLLRAGEPEEAVPVASESIDVQRRLGYEQGVSLGLATQAYAYLAIGDRQRAQALLDESMRLARRLGYQHGLVYCLNAVGRLAYESGDLERAATAFTGAHSLRVEMGIEHDPDDALVAPARNAVERELGLRFGDETGVDVDELVAALL